MAARLGFKGLASVPEDFASAYAEARRLAVGAARPLAVTDDATAEPIPGGARVGGMPVTGELAARHLAGAGSASLVLLTLGPGVDDMLSRASAGGDALLAFLADGVASELAEFCVRSVDQGLRDERPGLRGGARISPGFGDLPLRLNAWLVDRLGGGEVGVSVRPDSFALVPRKTVTAIIAWKGHGQA